MLLRTICLSLVLFSLTPAIVSCSDDGKHSPAAERHPEIESLIQSVQAVEVDLSRGFLLRSATPRVQSEFRDNLYKVRAAAYLLRENPRDAVGLAQLHQCFQRYETLNLIQDDRTLLEAFIASLRETLDSLTSLQGVSLDGFGDERMRTLFTHNFNLANDMGDFRAFTPPQSRAQAWKVTSCGPRCGNLEYLIAQVEKAGDETWLLSPGMVLPDREDLSLALEGSVRGPLVDVQGDQSLRRFSVLVSEQNQGGMPRDSEGWVDMSEQLINFPGGKYAAQFRGFKIEVDLARFRGKSVRIALKLAARDSQIVPERPETQWQLNRFSLIGKGQLTLMPASVGATDSRPDPATTQPSSPSPSVPVSPVPAALPDECGGDKAQSIYKPLPEELSKRFTIRGEAPFVTFAVEREPKFIKFSGRLKEGEQMVNKAGRTWLLSEAIQTKDVKKLCLSVDSALWFADAGKAQAEILIATDYQGSEETATWKKISLPAGFMKTDKSPNAANLISFKGLPLSELLQGGESFVLALRYTSDTASAPWWGVKGLEITGLKP